MGKRALPTAVRMRDGDEASGTCLMLESIVRRINAATTAILKESDLTLEQWRVLDCLIHQREMPMTELAAAVMMPPPSVTRAVDRLVSRALVYRSAAMNDRRRVLVHASRRGEELHARIAPEVAEAHGSAFDVFSRDERTTFHQLVTRLQASG